MLETILREELESLSQRQLRRSLKALRPIASTRADWNGKTLTLFCGNDYLGISRHPRVIQAAKECLEDFGVGAGAARLISGTTEFHQKLEQELALFRKKGKALVFSAGYLANVGVLTALAGKGDLVVMDKLCHASLIDGARLSSAELRIFPHKNYERCKEIFDQSKGYRRRFLVSDTVFSMDGDLADLVALVRIKEKYDALLIADDAHGMGVLGTNGSGAIEEAGLEDKVDVITGTLSKSLGCLGGFVVGSETAVDYLVNHARPFIFATALPPLLCAAASAALRVLQEEMNLRQALWDNIHTLEHLLKKSGINLPSTRSAILPIIVGSEHEALIQSQRLLEQGFLVPAIRYPTVAKGKARLRVTLSACHTHKDLEQFSEALRESLGK